MTSTTNGSNSSSPSTSIASSPTSPTSAAASLAASVAAATAAMVSSSLYLPQTYSFLSPETFETLVEGYINQLHIRKRNKALINQQLANDCLMVLTNPENTAIFNPKFRWWVRKHFVFTVVGELRILMDKKNGKPVCVREQLYDKVCYFHHIIGHGGRDKTFAAITKSYSKVPAELVSLFTKNCQTCLGVRKYSKNKRPILNEFEYPGQTSPAPQPQPQHCISQQQHSQRQPPQQQYHQHVRQQQASHHPHLQLTCNTSFATGLGRHHGHNQSVHSMMGATSKTELGTISPISPMMHNSGSSFFGSNGQLHSAYSQAAAAAAAATVAQSQQQHQQQQLQQQHHAALATHLNMSMSLSDISLGGHLSTSPASLGSDDSQSILSKMELPLHQLMHPGHHSHSSQQHHSQHTSTVMTSGLHNPTDLSEHHFLPQQEASPEASSVGDYSPTLSQQYLHSTQQQQQQQQNDYTQSFNYSTALSMSTYPQQAHQQQQQSLESSMSPSPILSQAELFQKQIQHADHYHHSQHRFTQQQQQQHQRFFSEGLMDTDLSTPPTSTAASAVPSMHITTVFSAAVAAAAAMSSIPTPTSASPLSNLLDENDDDCGQGHHNFSEHHHQHEMAVGDL